MSVIAINNNKGGVLKTTITTNLAGILAKQGKKVLIIDTDNQGNVSLSFNENPDKLEKTIFNVLVEDIYPEEAIVMCYESEKGGLIDILPSNDDLVFFDFDVIGNKNKFPKPFHLLKEKCEHLRKRYDYILIDSPPSLSLMVGNVLTFADQVLIPFQPEQYSRRSLLKILKAIGDFKGRYNGNLEVLGVLATLVDQRTVLHSEVLQATRQYCDKNNIQMFDTVIPKSVRFASSVAYDGLPATIADEKHKSVKAYYELWKEIEENVRTKTN